MRSDFSGGLNTLLGDNSKIAENCYFTLFNARSLKKVIQPNKKAVAEVVPVGTVYQGNYNFGQFRLMFVDGKAFYRDISIVGSAYNQIGGFLMSPTAPIIFAELIPGSTINYPRTLVDEASAAYGVQYDSSPLAPSPAAVIAMDGINQPWLILADGTSRVTQNYQQWTDDNREYVPIGTRPMFADGVLYMVDRDGISILRSVSGRPVDFMVIIDTNGQKLPSELAGGAKQVSYQVGFDQIIALGKTVTPGTFLVGTQRNVFQVSKNTATLLFGEPIYQTISTWEYPISGPFAFIPSKTDTYIIGQEGITCVTDLIATVQDNQGIASPILGIFENITQPSTVGGVNYKQYVLFLCETPFGRCIIAYNRILQIWEAYDTPTGFFGEMVQLSVSRVGNKQRVFALTSEGESLELYAHETETDLVRFYPCDHCPPNQKLQTILVGVNALVKSPTTDGTLAATWYVDEIPLCTQVLRKAIKNTVIAGFPVRPNYQLLGGNNPIANRGFRVGAEISWDTDAQLTAVCYDLQYQTVDVSPVQQATNDTTTRRTP